MIYVLHCRNRKWQVLPSELSMKILQFRYVALVVTESLIALNSALSYNITISIVYQLLCCNNKCSKVLLVLITYINQTSYLTGVACVFE